MKTTYEAEEGFFSCPTVPEIKTEIATEAKPLSMRAIFAAKLAAEELLKK